MLYRDQLGKLAGRDRAQLAAGAAARRAAV